MDSKIGFIIKVKSKGREYFYLRKSIWEDNKSKNKNIFSFGIREKAIKDLNNWQNDISRMPKELKNMGYNLNDVKIWIKEIEHK